MECVLLIFGLGLLLVGANYLVDSSVAIAQRAKISNFVIGLTIVGIGTSSPELFVSLSSSIQNLGDMSMGNVVGSNICNVLLILGITAIILPFKIERETMRRDIPMAIFAAIMLLVLTYDSVLPRISTNTLSRFDGFILLLIFAIYMFLIFNQKGKALDETEENASSSLTGKSPWILWSIAIASLAMLVYGGTLFIDSATILARHWGIPDAVISITLVAVGTSLPELITCVFAAIKGNAQLALGNALGSNIFNIFMILGLSSLANPIIVSGVGILDFGVLLISSLLTFIVAFSFGKRRFDRIEGIIFLAIYVGYTALLLMK